MFYNNDIVAASGYALNIGKSTVYMDDRQIIIVLL